MLHTQFKKTNPNQWTPTCKFIFTKELRFTYSVSLVRNVCSGHFLLWWERHSLSHHYTNAQQHKHRGVKNPSVARKRPHWNGETTETKYCCLLPFVFSSFPKLVLQQGDSLMDGGGKRRAILLGEFRAAQQSRWRVLLRCIMCRAVEVAVHHLWAHHSTALRTWLCWSCCSAVSAWANEPGSCQNQVTGKGNNNDINSKEKNPNRYKLSTSENQVINELWTALL